MLRISGAATDIRSFLANEATSSFPISNLPSSCSCPLPPWQYALIALASLHVLCFIINISVQCPPHVAACMLRLICSNSDHASPLSAHPCANFFCFSKLIPAPRFQLAMTPFHVPLVGWFLCFKLHHLKLAFKASDKNAIL